MWQLWQQSKTFSCRPSELLSISDPLIAWMMDNAVHHMGSTLEAQLQEAGSKKSGEGKQRSILTRWGILERRFRDPMTERR